MCCNKNQPSNLGSSETTREAPLFITSKFDFSLYFKNAQPDHLKLNDVTFLQWFIGFSEGDGSFIISKNRCSFVINQKEIALLYNIRTRLGFGKVMIYQQGGVKYGRYYVQSRQNCLRLAMLFNGNLVLAKTNQRFLKWLQILEVVCLNRRTAVELTNGWLSGFINAEGCFSARIRKNLRAKTGRQFIQKFSLTQANDFQVLKKILDLFESKSSVQTVANKNNTDVIYYKIEIQSQRSNKLLLNYLEQYPNLGNKMICIKVYSRLSGYLPRNEHLTEIGLNRMKILCNQLIKHRLSTELPPEMKSLLSD
jgi:DNA-binding ferritin-like protein (Dps family)